MAGAGTAGRGRRLGGGASGGGTGFMALVNKGVQGRRA